MGTRADFYIKEQEKFEWLGSIAWDGYAVAEQGDINAFSPNDIAKRTEGYIEHLINQCRNANDFRELVAEYLGSRRDGTKPEMGWPWPWNNSKLTDECYVFDTATNELLRMASYDGNHKDASTPCQWVGVNTRIYDEDGELIEVDKVEFCVPDMTSIKNEAPLGSKRSGIMVIVVPQ